jgi:dTDP-glucose 4,6-dehydratase
LLDELHPMEGGARHERLLRFVPDRPGHDRRYVVNASRLHGLAGWMPVESVDSGLRKTVIWHLGNRPNLAKAAGRPALLHP